MSLDKECSCRLGNHLFSYDTWRQKRFEVEVWSENVQMSSDIGGSPKVRLIFRIDKKSAFGSGSTLPLLTSGKVGKTRLLRHSFYSKHSREYLSKLLTDHSSGERWYKIIEVHFSEMTACKYFLSIFYLKNRASNHKMRQLNLCFLSFFNSQI